jgi:hypothetical protein
MEYVKLGTTGLDVSPIAIGAMSYGEPDRGHPVWSLSESDARPLIRHALDAGTNFFDTANMYSQGSSEEILGRALCDFANRDDVVIAAKLRHSRPAAYWIAVRRTGALLPAGTIRCQGDYRSSPAITVLFTRALTENGRRIGSRPGVQFPEEAVTVDGLRPGLASAGITISEEMVAL